MVRFASEDIGLADNRALEIEVSIFQAFQFIGMPECDVHLTQARPKSITSCRIPPMLPMSALQPFLVLACQR
nr:hypothetical protein [Paenibacillus sp. Aloe-11]